MNAKTRKILEAQWEAALKLWCDEYTYWDGFHRRSLVMGGAKQSEAQIQEVVVSDRIMRTFLKKAAAIEQPCAVDLASGAASERKRKTKVSNDRNGTKTGTESGLRGTG